ncbi:MAG: TolC family protein, partial [Bacteroidales bacterium]|nr:TolC family protein [Bacteroidales bacterium]
SDLALSLEEAQEYALKNNKMIKASRLDIESARLSTWDAKSGGMPQVNATASLMDNLKLATMLIPDFTGMSDDKIAVQFGSQFNTSYGFQVTQLLFSGSYFVGVQTAKLAESLSVQGLEKSELAIKESVISTYYLILITEESIEVLDDNINNLKEILASTKAMYEVGMAEATDVDQMQSSLTMLTNSMKSLERNLEVSYNLMRFQLGLDTDAGIELTQTLDDFIEEINVTALSLQDFNIQSNIDYRLLSSQEKLGELTVKMQKSTVLPTLSGFYQYNQSGQADKLNRLDWYGSQVLGLQLNVPIFASGQRYSKIRKAQIDLESLRTNKSLVTDQLLMQEKQLKYNLINANEQFISRKENIELANRVFTSVENKYKQGVASSLDLTQAHNNYLQAVSDYTSSFMSLLQTKLALDKLLNNL